MRIKLPYLMAVTLCAIGVIYGTSSHGLNASPTTRVVTLKSQHFELGTPGEARLVSFYSPDCAFSRRDMASLTALHNQFQGNDANVIAVAMHYDTAESIAEFSEKNGIKYHLAHDTDGRIARVFPNVRFTPTTFLLDKSGKIAWRHTGKLPLDEARKQLIRAVEN